MSPRRSVAATRDTRAMIVERATQIASVDGLEGLTIGQLAGDVGMSKSGLIRHFDSKQQLQLATLDAAVAVFRRVVWEPAEHAAPGRARLAAICDAWRAYLVGDAFPGGCFLTAAATEFDGRPGPVRDAVAATLRHWNAVLRQEAATAVAAGELPSGTDPEQVAFELGAIAAALNQRVQLMHDPDAEALAARAMRRTLAAA